MRRKFISLVGVGLMAIGISELGLRAQSASCGGALSVPQKDSLVQYVRARYRLPETIGLTLESEATVKDTCYRELAFQGKSAVKTWELKLYASPDLRFLASDLLDTSVDPVAEERAKSEALMLDLTKDALAVRGPEKAAVTIVEFSDFQCPFCRRFADMLNGVLADGAPDVRVVFHHMPLSGRAWADRRLRWRDARSCRAPRRSGRCTTRFSRHKQR